MCPICWNEVASRTFLHRVFFLQNNVTCDLKVLIIVSCSTHEWAKDLKLHCAVSPSIFNAFFNTYHLVNVK